MKKTFETLKPGDVIFVDLFPASIWKCYKKHGHLCIEAFICDESKLGCFKNDSELVWRYYKYKQYITLHVPLHKMRCTECCLDTGIVVHLTKNDFKEYLDKYLDSIQD